MKDIYNELTIQYKVSLESGGAPISAAPDLSILKKTEDPEWFYALSPDRVNAIEYFPWNSNMDVLEIGADYGVYAGLADRVRSWTVIDNEPKRLELLRHRYAGTASEKLGLKAEAAAKSYDAVVLSMLDITPERAGQQTDPEKLITDAAEYLRDGGCLIVIADNAHALKSMTGAIKADKAGNKSDDKSDSNENTGLSITKDLIDNIRSAGTFAEVREFYPLPDAAYAKNIFSDKRLPGAGDFRGISESFRESRYVLCREEAIYGSLCSAGAFREFAPSYIVVFAGYKADEKNAYVNTTAGLPVYIKYNRMRDEKFALKTELFENDGTRLAIKTALYSGGNAHIEEFEKRRKLLEADSDGKLEILEAKISHNGDGLAAAAFDYVEGMDLARELSLKISGGKAPHKAIESAIELLLGSADAACHNMDALFENVISGKDGKKTLIDYEWVFENKLDREYLRYRILKYWYEAYSGLLSAYGSLTDLLAEFEIDTDRTEEFEKKELSFQEYVRGDSKALEERFTKEQTYAADVAGNMERLRESLERIEILKDEISEHKAALSKEREVERLSQNHIRNIELINKAQAEQIASMAERLSYLERHESILSRCKRRMVAKIDAWAPADSKKRVLIHYAKDTVKHPVKMIGQYLSGQGRLLISGDLNIGGEFHEGGILNIPQCEAPLVSIVIPAYNQVAYTYACIRSIIEKTDLEKTPYEIILADDVSTDVTKEIYKYINGLVISRNSSNMGFLKNCNQAAKKARGTYILFLNNDTKVHENWLSALVKLIGSDESIGMVGSKLVYPDGRLQEAGGIIWSDASGWNYGRLDDPDKPEYNYVKDVDYISGAAIMLSAQLWNEIGGFDERFAPAYCEDSDLAFEVRKRGRRVVYQPESVVTHFEGISNGTDVAGSGLKRYQVVNAEKFKEKWKDELKKQQVNTGSPDPFTARDRSKDKPCIVIVDHYVPTWDKDAGSKTTYQYIRMFLKKGFNVKFVGDNFLHEEPYSSELQQLGVEILYGHEYENGILEWFKKNSENIDFCYLNRPHIAVKYIDFLKRETRIKCIFYGHDLHFLRLFREYELTGDISKLRESNYWKSVELSVMEEADMVYYPSESEIEAIHAVHPEIPAKAITAYLWDSFKTVDNSALAFEKRKDLLFVGGFKHPPNADGVKWFAEKIFPRIRKAVPDVNFLIAGSGAGEDILSLDSEKDGIRVLGFVSDERLDELYASTRLTVVPLRYGAGVKGKVVEAVYNAAAVVTTSVGAEGIPYAQTVMSVVDEDPSLIYDHAEAVEKGFAEEVIRLYKDPELCAGLSESCSRYIREHYSLEAAWSVIEEDFRSADSESKEVSHMGKESRGD